MHDREHLLTAWTEAFPWVSAKAFSLGLVRLDARGREAGELEAELELFLRTRSRGQTLDAIELLQRRGLWLEDAGRGAVTLVEFAVRLARRYLQWNGTSLSLSSPYALSKLASNGALTDTASLARRWRWLTLAMPEDLLIAALCAGDALVGEPPSDSIELLPIVAQQVMQKPCSETHVHISASVHFAQLWSGWIGPGIDALRSPREVARASVPLGGMRRFAPIAAASAIVRLLLAAFLRAKQQGERGDFRAFVRAQASAWESYAPGATRLVGEAVATLCDPDKPTLSSALGATLYRRVRGPSPKRPASPHEFDPLSQWLGAHSSSPETRFATRAMRFLLASADDLFARCFWQYQRVRVAVFRHVTLEPGTPGLDWFSTGAKQSELFRRPIDGDLVLFASQHANRGVSLASLELRTNFSGSTAAKLRRDLVRFARSVSRVQRLREAQRQPPLEVGLLLHFRKFDGGARRSPWSVPVADTRARWHGWVELAMRQVRAVDRLLSIAPELLLLLRAVDLAGRELSMPSWPALLPLIEARKASRCAAQRLAVTHPSWRVRPLSITVHAGEDYRRLVEGLRRVDEFFRYGVLESGDRIGHGLSLADDPRRRCPSGSRALQPLVDRLDDLLWEFALYCHGELSAPDGRGLFVEQEILRLGAELYGPLPGVSAVDYVRARDLRHDGALLWRWGVGNSSVAAPAGVQGNAAELLRRYLFDVAVSHRGEQVLEVSSDERELRFAADAQRMLRARVAAMQITVESNPSSNHLIADLDGLDAHPALSLQPLHGQKSDLPPVLLSLNTDDPVVFATSLIDEYAHTYYTLVRAGIGSQEAMRWLEQVRENGHRSRFTLTTSDDPARVESVADATAFD